MSAQLSQLEEEKKQYQEQVCAGSVQPSKQNITY